MVMGTLRVGQKVLTTFDQGTGTRYFTYMSKKHHLTLRFGIEQRPLFSERNKTGARWFYLFGKRVSFRWYKNPVKA
jgi:hypothetical protein